MVEHLLDRPQDELRIGVEVLVDRRADDDDDVLGVRRRRGIVARLEPAGREHLARAARRRRARRTASCRPAPGRRRRVAVVEHDRTAGVGERQAEREPDVAAAPDNHDILGESGTAPSPRGQQGVNRTCNSTAASIERRTRGRASCVANIPTWRLMLQRRWQLAITTRTVNTVGAMLTPVLAANRSRRGTTSVRRRPVRGPRATPRSTPPWRAARSKQPQWMDPHPRRTLPDAPRRSTPSE